MTMTTDNPTYLEDAIDRVGLAAVLSLITEICDAKADHLRSNWQDEAAARAWEQAAVKVNSASYYAVKAGL